jgi:Ca2+:H+ antiporter
VAVRAIITNPVITRILIGWLAVGALIVFSPSTTMAGPALAVVLAAIVAVIAFCAFGVVHQAEHLARRLGDPYGSLVLTLSIVVIEVILISAVMLGPGDHSTIARDSVMAVSMVIMNLVVGTALLAGGLRFGHLRLNRAGSSTYLAMLIVLVAFALVLPAVLGGDGTYNPLQQAVISVMTVAVYAFFLLRQTTVEAQNYREPEEVPVHGEPRPGTTTRTTSISTVLRTHRTEITTRTGVLLVTALPIVLLSHHMAALLDEGLARLGAPVALAGLLIAMIVFLPEGITAVRAGWNGEAQRVMNLCHGALVSTVGLTIPAVLTIGALTGQAVVLAETPAHILLLAVTLMLAMNTINARRITSGHGAVLLTVFVTYVLTIFA